MTERSYKIGINLLIKNGKLNQYVDHLDASEDGNLWLIVVDDIEELERRLFFILLSICS